MEELYNIEPIRLPNLIIPDWNDNDQEILEWLFPVLRDEDDIISMPGTPEKTESAHPCRCLMRTKAFNSKQWGEILGSF